MLDEERPRAYDRMLKLTFEFGISALLGFDLNSKEIKTSYNTFHDLVSNIFSMPYRIPGFGFDKVSSHAFLSTVLNVVMNYSLNTRIKMLVLLVTFKTWHLTRVHVHVVFDFAAIVGESSRKNPNATVASRGFHERGNQS